MNTKKQPTYDEKLKALKKSIEHWEENAEDPKNANTNSSACACCGLVTDEEEFIRCKEGCPIYEKTGNELCHGTPYINIPWNSKEWTKEMMLAEVVFLKNLYIEMLENPPSKEAEEKEEEWEDITDECKTNVEVFTGGETQVSIQMSDGFYLYTGELEKCLHVPYEFKVEDDRILRRQTK